MAWQGNICLQCEQIQSLGQEDPLEKGMATHSIPVFLPGESHRQRSLAGYSPWGRKDSDTLSTHTHRQAEGWEGFRHCDQRPLAWGSHEWGP